MKRALAGKAIMAAGAVCIMGALAPIGARALAIQSTRAAATGRWNATKAIAGDMIHVTGGADRGAFFIDTTEVTVAAYRACVEAGACTPASAGRFCNGAAKDRDDHPINCVDHAQAEAFCAWAGRRLPTQREWAVAACGSGAELPWEEPVIGPAAPQSDAPRGCYGRSAVYESVGWMSTLKSEAKGTCAVTDFSGSASHAGALGMASNVSEWTSTEEPPGSRYYVDMGGHWRVRAAEARSYTCSSDVAHPPSFRDDAIGFRCARDEDEPPWAAVLSPR
jgi:formylglycine-generating enzyme required for sulfatase activity